MNCTTEEDGTKRYKKQSTFDISGETYFFGCEFEFYPNEDFKLEDFIKDLYDISEVDLLVNELTIPKCSDSDSCMHLKKDISLKDSGFEISTPKTSYDKLLFYIEKINNLIKKYGNTNSDTGFHIHISTNNSDGVNFDFYKFVLLCNQEKLLYIWESRNEYCKNVMDIISCNTKKESKIIKNSKGKVWNLEKISNNRIEVRIMGGEDYHLKTEQILKELEKYFKIFKETLEKDTEKYISLKKEHLENIKSSPKENISKFVKLFKIEL